MEHAKALCLGGVKPLGRYKITSRRRLAHGTHDVGRDGGRQQAQLRFTQTNLHPMCRHSDVAHTGQPHAAGITIAMQTRNDGHRAAANGPQHVRERLRIGPIFLPAVICHSAHPAQVSARAKGLSMSAEHHCTQVIILGELLELIAQLGDHLVIKRVTYIGAIEVHIGYAGASPRVECGLDCLGHRSSCYMRKTPKRVSGIGARSAAAKPKASTRRVSTGSMMPSSHKRAVA